MGGMWCSRVVQKVAQAWGCGDALDMFVSVSRYGVIDFICVCMFVCVCVCAHTHTYTSKTKESSGNCTDKRISAQVKHCKSSRQPAASFVAQATTA